MPFQILLVGAVGSMQVFFNRDYGRHRHSPSSLLLPELGSKPRTIPFRVELVRFRSRFAHGTPRRPLLTCPDLLVALCSALACSRAHARAGASYVGSFHMAD